MRKILLPLLAFLSITLIGQNTLQYNINLSTPGSGIKFDALGFNGERKFYRILDSNGNLADEAFEDMMRVGDVVYRWPGGATANFYHLDKPGYGLSRFEVDFIPDPMNCDFSSNTTDYCMVKDTQAVSNFIYPMLALAERYHQSQGKPLRMVWIPNFLTFYINDSSQINNLRGVTTLTELHNRNSNGLISDGFLDRIYENINAFNILNNHPSIDLVGIEYGNEIYYHTVVTALSYNGVNSLSTLLFNIFYNDLKAAIMPGVTRYKSLVEFYNNILDISNRPVKTALPAAVISHLGGMGNLNRLWNEAMRDSVLSLVDGVIHHQYVKIQGTTIRPDSSEDPENEAKLNEIKSLIDQFLFTRLPNIDKAFDNFFGLAANNKTLWVTEFNMDSGIFDGLLYRWMNTFLHGYFTFEYLLSSLDNNNDHNAVEFAFLHNFIGPYNEYRYPAYTADYDGTNFNKTVNTPFYAFEVLSDLIVKDIRKVNFTAQNTQGKERKDLYLSAFYEMPGTDISAPDSGAVYLVFSNKSGTPATINLANAVTITGIDPALPRNPAEAKYLKAGHIYSSNGRTEFSNTPTNDVEYLEETGIDLSSTFEVPGYAFGYIRLPYTRIIRPSAVNDRKTIPLHIFPNPAKNYVVIRTSDLSTEHAKVELFNLLGEVVSAKMTRLSAGEIQLHTEQLPVGTYFCRIQTAKGIATGSFVKQ
jgi:hypothetical protein